MPLEPYKDGNQRSDGNHNFAYNVMGRLLRVYTPDWANVEMEYEYNADGLRVAKKDKNGKVERYVYNGGKLAYITDDVGTVRFFFTRSTSGALLNMIDYTGASPVTYWYIKDAHGNVIGLGDEAGSVVASYEYDALGNILASSGSVSIGDGSKLLKDANPFRYSSYFYDEETKLYYLNARYYSPELGRFLSMDPVPGLATDGISQNSYLYARNNPVIYVDPNGLSFELVLEGDIAPRFNEAEPATVGQTQSPQRNTTNEVLSVSVTRQKLGKTGPPNSVGKLYGRNGEVLTERYYGPDRRAVRDKHFWDHGNAKEHPKVPHEHDWDWSNGEGRLKKEWYAKGALIVAGYFAYRGLRIVPSLFPTLWWTIPVNIATP